MYYTLAFVPGGQPIGALEKFFAKAWKSVAKYLPGRRKRKAAA
jgi:lipopolysaccharide export system permease protein